ncbi:MAG TPA: hypothetical protein DCE23_00085 [Firmicutes bacterium]|nr:hypothetical protein [Bacillota bacterium]
MGALKMESSELRNLGNNITNNANSFDELISSFKNAYEAITANGTWDGEDSNKFREAADKFRTDLEKASQIVHEVGSDLVTTANDYDETLSSVSSNIGTML